MPIDSMRPVLEGLVARLIPPLPGSALGDVLNQLLWLTDDNGTDVIGVCREWLAGDDPRRIEAALSIDEGWLYDSRAELHQHLEMLTARWPHVAPRVKEILEAYDRQHQQAV